MKIIAFNGSPRGKKSNTDRILLPFLAGTEKAGATSEVVYLAEEKVKSCLGCFHCWTKKPGECVIKDEMGDLIQKITEADTLVFATPLYFYTMSGLMKDFCDRLLPLFEPYFIPYGDETAHPVRHKKQWNIVLISNAGFPDENPFSALIETFRHIAKGLGKNQKVDVAILRSFGELLTVPELEKRVASYFQVCEQAGFEFVNTGQLSEKTKVNLNKPLVSLEREQIIKMTNEFWQKTIEGSTEKDNYSNNMPFSISWKKTGSQTCHEMIKSMPWVYKGDPNFSAIFQFNINGDESFQCYLEMKDGFCHYYDGVHPSPSLTVISPASVWLEISNKKLSGAKGLMTGKYKVQGNMLLLLKMDQLFPR